MSRLPRPHIPLAVRVEVAARQVRERLKTPIEIECGPSLKRRLYALLSLLFNGDQAHLDHDPPLGARDKIMRDGEIVGYRPDANDPRCLIYRTKVAHQIKTNVRGEHGQHPDRVLIKKQRRRERPPSKRHKAKIAQPKNFKWPSRPFNRRKR
jgi:hypothetical protein